jgi:hypothetical protein
VALRALAAVTPHGTRYRTLREFADRADALEASRNLWSDTASAVDAEFGRMKRERDSARELLELRDAQVERVRALADEYARGRGGPTAKRIRAALDGAQ